MSDLSISKISFERSHDGFGIFSSHPRISWRFAGNKKDWKQKSYTICIGEREYTVESEQSTFVPWPGHGLTSGHRVDVSIQAEGVDGSVTGWKQTTVEATLLEKKDWTATPITCSESFNAPDLPKRPIYLRKIFNVSLPADDSARLYITALGLYEAEINGKRVGDQVLAPGWTTYDLRQYFQTYDVTDLLEEGENTIAAVVGEGWYAGRLGVLGGRRNNWGSRIGLFAQLMIDGETIVQTDDSWEWSPGPILTSEIYDGETVDSRIRLGNWSGGESGEEAVGLEWKAVEVLPELKSEFLADMSPIRRTQEVEAVKVIKTPAGKTVIDFGQNLAGWVRINTSPSGGKDGEKLLLRHAEIMEAGEIYTQDLRSAKARVEITLGGDIAGYEPKFTTHGFRYCQVEGWPGDVMKEDFTAVVVHSDMERIGWFECSHPLITKLHENAVWTLRSNFVGIPTDCCQRDERLGWMGDAQLAASSAAFMYDTNSSLSGWLRNVLADQMAHPNQQPPMMSPDTLSKANYFKPGPSSVWHDAVVLTPWDVYQAYGDKSVLADQYEGMTAWVDKVIKRRPDGLWDDDTYQLGDHLDPAAPPNNAGGGVTDQHLIANAYLVQSTRVLSKVAKVLDKKDDAARYSADADRLGGLFRAEYVTDSGRLASDSQTAFALVLAFDLLKPEQRANAAKRLDKLVKKKFFVAATGFVGTQVIWDALVSENYVPIAYRILQDKQCPSFMHMVFKGATTMWERYNSLLPDDTSLRTEMNSFNHIPYIAVATFMHKTIGGISMLEPGYKKVLIRPQPGGTVTAANTKEVTPYGEVVCTWKIEGDKLKVKIAVPPNTTARVVLPGVQEEVGSGEREYEVDYEQDGRWPPKPPFVWVTVPVVDEIA